MDKYKKRIVRKKYNQGGNIGSGIGTALGAAAGTLLFPGIGTAAGATIGGGLGSAIGTGVGQNQQQGIKPPNQMILTPEQQMNQSMGMNPYGNSTMYANGGNLTEYKGFNHENGGIPLGNTGNEVEDGEVRTEDYVFSDRLKVSKNGVTYAQAAKRIRDKYSNRSNDKIDQTTMQKELEQLAQQQESVNKTNDLEEGVNIELKANGGNLNNDGDGGLWDKIKNGNWGVGDVGQFHTAYNNKQGDKDNMINLIEQGSPGYKNFHTPNDSWAAKQFTGSYGVGSFGNPYTGTGGQALKFSAGIPILGGSEPDGTKRQTVKPTAGVNPAYYAIPGQKDSNGNFYQQHIAGQSIPNLFKKDPTGLGILGWDRNNVGSKIWGSTPTQSNYNFTGVNNNQPQIKSFNERQTSIKTPTLNDYNKNRNKKAFGGRLGDPPPKSIENPPTNPIKSTIKSIKNAKLYNTSKNIQNSPYNTDVTMIGEYLDNANAYKRSTPEYQELYNSYNNMMKSVGSNKNKNKNQSQDVYYNGMMENYKKNTYMDNIYQQNGQSTTGLKAYGGKINKMYSGGEIPPIIDQFPNIGGNLPISEVNFSNTGLPNNDPYGKNDYNHIGSDQIPRNAYGKISPDYITRNWNNTKPNRIDINSQQSINNSNNERLGWEYDYDTGVGPKPKQNYKLSGDLPGLPAMNPITNNTNKLADPVNNGLVTGDDNVKNKFDLKGKLAGLNLGGNGKGLNIGSGNGLNINTSDLAKTGLSTLGGIYDVARGLQGGNFESYGRINDVKLNQLDPTRNIQQQREAGRSGLSAIRNVGGQGLGQYLNNAAAITSGTQKNVANIQSQYDNANLGILNQQAQLNNQIQGQNIGLDLQQNDINARERDNASNDIQKGLTTISQGLNQQFADQSQRKVQDQMLQNWIGTKDQGVLTVNGNPIPTTIERLPNNVTIHTGQNGLRYDENSNLISEDEYQRLKTGNVAVGPNKPTGYKFGGRLKR